MLFNKFTFQPSTALTKYAIAGTVYEADGSTPIASATVALGALSDTSGADGTYAIEDIPAGTSGSLTCTKAGYSWPAKTIAAMAGELANQNFINSWWAFGGISANCVGAYLGKGAASLAASYINLANPGTNNLTPGTAPTWDATNGWIFASATPSLDSGIIVANNNYSMLVRFSNTGATTNASIIGSASPNFYIHSNREGPDGHRVVNGSFVYTALPKMTSGILGMAGYKCFVDGAYEGTTSGTGGISGTGTIKLGGRACNIQAAAVYNAVISDANMVGIMSAMAVLP